MPLFSRRHHTNTTTGYGPAHNHHHNHGTGHSHHETQGFGFFRRRKDPDRVAGGYKAALTNPNTTHNGRAHAKHELRKKGYSTHVPLMTKIRRTLGIRSSPHNTHHNHY